MPHLNPLTSSFPTASSKRTRTTSVSQWRRRSRYSNGNIQWTGSFQEQIGPKEPWRDRSRQGPSPWRQCRRRWFGTGVLSLWTGPRSWSCRRSERNQSLWSEGFRTLTFLFNFLSLWDTNSKSDGKLPHLEVVHMLNGKGGSRHAFRITSSASETRFWTINHLGDSGIEQMKMMETKWRPAAMTCKKRGIQLQNIHVAKQ